MSITKLINLNYSDGTKTLYTASSTINVPFPISHIRISNSYIISNLLSPIYQISCPMLQAPQSDTLTVCREYTPTNEVLHYYQKPKEINGQIDFPLSLGPELFTFNIVGDTHNILSPFVYIVGTFVPIGCTLNFAGMIGSVTILSQFSGTPNQSGEYQMSSPQTIDYNTVIKFQHPQYGLFYNLSSAHVSLMIEFYQYASIIKQPTALVNSMYYTWRFTDLSNSIQNIDVPFNVDEIQITSSCINDLYDVLYNDAMIALFSDLLYSDSTNSLISTNSYTNPLSVFSRTTGDSYEATNKQIYKYTQSRIIRGSYRVWASYLFSNITAPIVSTAIQILFIKY